MSELEIFESAFNQQVNNVNQSKALKQCGEFAFKLPNNKSGKLRIAFPSAYVKKPLLNVVVSVTNGSELDMRYTIAQFDVTGFTLHLLNTDTVNELAGVVNWWSSPFN